MKNKLLTGCAAIIMFSSCQKTLDVSKLTAPSTSTSQEKVTYTIFQGNNYCDKNTYQSTNYTELKFKTIFDSSAVYTTKLSSNQVDINKLFGFSDNNSTHQNFSARFGWRWYNSHVEIFAYIYNYGVVEYQKVGDATIGKEQLYSIKVNATNYVFTFNGTIVTMPRKSTTETATGYKLFPYFGGSEPAPHNVTIQITEL